MMTWKRWFSIGWDLLTSDHPVEMPEDTEVAYLKRTLWLVLNQQGEVCITRTALRNYNSEGSYISTLYDTYGCLHITAERF